MVIVIGHKNPDTDTVVCAVAMAALLKARGQEATPAVAGNINSETEFLFNKFNYEVPEVIDSTEDELFLVDHTEESQRIGNNVVGVVDHHNVSLNIPIPIEVTIKPWGCCSSVIYDMFKKEGYSLPEEIKPLLLGAMLSDTVILKSPTTTEVDRSFVQELADELKIDIQELGMNMFKAKSQVASKSAEEILFNDYKIFESNGKRFGVGQVETPDLTEVEAKVPELLEKMKEVKEKENLDVILLLLTDIIQEGSKMLIVGSEKADVFNTTISEGITEFIPGMLSRKKQVVPFLDQL